MVAGERGWLSRTLPEAAERARERKEAGKRRATDESISHKPSEKANKPLKQREGLSYSDRSTTV